MKHADVCTGHQTSFDDIISCHKNYYKTHFKINIV